MTVATSECPLGTSASQEPPVLRCSARAGAKGIFRVCSKRLKWTRRAMAAKAVPPWFVCRPRAREDDWRTWHCPNSPLCDNTTSAGCLITGPVSTQPQIQICARVAKIDWPYAGLAFWPAQDMDGNVNNSQQGGKNLIELKNIYNKSLQA